MSFSLSDDKQTLSILRRTTQRTTQQVGPFQRINKTTTTESPVGSFVVGEPVHLEPQPEGEKTEIWWILRFESKVTSMACLGVDRKGSDFLYMPWIYLRKLPDMVRIAAECAD